jgi:hypothetical protein
MTTSRTDTAPVNPPSKVSSELLDYLHTMITPTQIGGETLVTMDLGSIAWDTLADETYHGLIALGTPTEEQVEHIWRVVKPGAHVMLIAPDDCTTGYLGACALEDRGFEIRDAILVVDEPGHLYYVPKSNGKERNAGTEHLAVKRNGPPLYSLSEEAQQDEAALADLEAALADKNASNQELLNMVDAVLEGSSGIPRDNIPKDYRHLFEKQENLGKYGNNHPTVKPKDVMKALLAGVPKDKVILDPFMGSGTTGLACLETGHDFIGIEREPEYINIADARVRHWAHGWARVDIESEAPGVAVNLVREVPVHGGVFDMFGEDE